MHTCSGCDHPQSISPYPIRTGEFMPTSPWKHEEADASPTCGQQTPDTARSHLDSAPCPPLFPPLKTLSRWFWLSWNSQLERRGLNPHRCGATWGRGGCCSDLLRQLEDAQRSNKWWGHRAKSPISQRKPSHGVAQTQLGVSTPECECNSTLPVGTLPAYHLGLGSAPHGCFDSILYPTCYRCESGDAACCWGRLHCYCSQCRIPLLWIGAIYNPAMCP